MNVPISGIILLPLTLGIFCFSSYTAEWAIITAILQGAALVNSGGGFAVGLSPYFFVTALIALRLVPQLLTGKVSFFTDEPVRSHVHVLFMFTLWCAVSAFVLPLLFQGLPVDSPRSSVDSSYYTQLPLTWSFSNAGQAGYMILNLMLVLRILQLSTSQKRLERLINAFSWSGMLVAGVGVYQILCNRFGLPFPSWLFNSNQAWAELPNQLISGGFSRISATFPEPSGAASFLSAWSVFELSLAMGLVRQSGRHWLCAAVGTAVLIATASTTGYVVAAVMCVVMAWDCIGTLLRYGVIKTKVTLTFIGLGSAGIGCAGAFAKRWTVAGCRGFQQGRVGVRTPPDSDLWSSRRRLPEQLGFGSRTRLQSSDERVLLSAKQCRFARTHSNRLAVFATIFSGSRSAR